MGPVHSSNSSTIWETYSPAAITALETIQTHKQSLSTQVPTHSWVGRVHIQMKCLAHGHSATPRQPGLAPETSLSRVAGRSHHVTSPSMYMEHAFRYRDTEGGHCQRVFRPQWFFYVPLKSVRRHRHLRGHASHGRYTVSNVEGGRKSLVTNLSRNGARTPGRRRDRCTRLHCAIAPFNQLKFQILEVCVMSQILYFGIYLPIQVDESTICMSSYWQRYPWSFTKRYSCKRTKWEPRQIDTRHQPKWDLHVVTTCEILI